VSGEMGVRPGDRRAAPLPVRPMTRRDPEALSIDAGQAYRSERRRTSTSIGHENRMVTAQSAVEGDERW
jgi:hypothetical protein